MQPQLFRMTTDVPHYLITLFDVYSLRYAYITIVAYDYLLILSHNFSSHNYILSRNGAIRYYH